MSIGGGIVTTDFGAIVLPQDSGVIDQYREGLFIAKSALPNGNDRADIITVRDFSVASLATVNILPYQMRTVGETEPHRHSDNEQIFLVCISGYLITLIDTNGDDAQAIEVTFAGLTNQGSNPTRVAMLEGLNSTTRHTWLTPARLDVNTTLDFESKVAGAGATVRVVVLGQSINSAWDFDSVTFEITPRIPLRDAGLWVVNEDGDGLDANLDGKPDLYWEIQNGDELVMRTL